MSLNHGEIYEESSEDNPLIPYDVFDSRRILGLAAYIILGIRPDAAHAAAIVARFTGSKQTEKVIENTVRLAWYLVDTQEECVLTYRKSSDGMNLWSMVDSSFNNDPVTKRSYFGYVLKCGANPIAWRSKLESSVSLSTRDAELFAAIHCVQHTCLEFVSFYKSWIYWFQVPRGCSRIARLHWREYRMTRTTRVRITWVIV